MFLCWLFSNNLSWRFLRYSSKVDTLDFSYLVSIWMLMISDSIWAFFYFYWRKAMLSYWFRFLSSFAYFSSLMLDSYTFSYCSWASEYFFRQISHSSSFSVNSLSFFESFYSKTFNWFWRNCLSSVKDSISSSLPSFSLIISNTLFLIFSKSFFSSCILLLCLPNSSWYCAFSWLYWESCWLYWAFYW